MEILKRKNSKKHKLYIFIFFFFERLKLQKKKIYVRLFNVFSFKFFEKKRDNLYRLKKFKSFGNFTIFKEEIQKT